jgi:hypothetical protein
MSLSFAREEVMPPAAAAAPAGLRQALGGGLPPPVRAPSAASSSSSSSADAPAAAAAASPATAAAAPPPPSAAERPPLQLQSGVTVGSVVSAVSAAAALPAASSYELRIAGDDGEAVDGDFPAVDASVAIAAVGPRAFILVDAASERPLLRVRLPAAAGDAAAAADLGEAHDADGVLVLNVTWVPHKGASPPPPLPPFVVRLTAE